MCVCVCAVHVCVCPHPVGEGIPGEDGPSPPVHVVEKILVHMLPEAVDVAGRQFGGQLQVLVLEDQRGEGGVQAERVRNKRGRRTMA